MQEITLSRNNPTLIQEIVEAGLDYNYSRNGNGVSDDMIKDSMLVLIKLIEDYPNKSFDEYIEALAVDMCRDYNGAQTMERWKGLVESMHKVRAAREERLGFMIRLNRADSELSRSADVPSQQSDDLTLSAATAMLERTMVRIKAPAMEPISLDLGTKMQLATAVLFNPASTTEERQRALMFINTNATELLRSGQVIF